MNTTNKRIEILLNSKSFVNWLKGSGSLAEKKKWDQWINENPEHLVIAKKVEKILNLPFRESEPQNVEAELARLKKSISDLKSEPGNTER